MSCCEQVVLSEGGHCAVYTFELLEIGRGAGAVIIRSLRLSCCKEVVPNSKVMALATSRATICV